MKSTAGGFCCRLHAVLVVAAGHNLRGFGTALRCSKFSAAAFEIRFFCNLFHWITSLHDENISWGHSLLIRLTNDSAGVSPYLFRPYCKTDKIKAVFYIFSVFQNIDRTETCIPDA